MVHLPHRCTTQLHLKRLHCHARYHGWVGPVALVCVWGGAAAAAAAAAARYAVGGRVSQGVKPRSPNPPPPPLIYYRYKQ